MTQTSKPWNSGPGDGSAAYSAETWQALQKLLSGDQGTASPRGPLFTDQRDVYKVSQRAAGANMSVDVAAGTALVDGIEVDSDAVENLVIGASDPTLNRIDRVVLQANTTLQTVRLAVKAGTPGVTPSPPVLVTDRTPYFEIPIAQAYVAAAVSSILDAALTDERYWLGIPNRVYVRVTNKSGGTLAMGDVVVWDDANTKSVKTTTTADDPNVCGVVADPMANNAEGRICVLGIHPVRVSIAVGIGYALGCSATVKCATYQKANSFARALAATAGAGLVQAFVNVKPVYPAAAQAIRKGLYSIDTNVWTDVDSTNLSLVITTHGGPVDINFSTTCIALGADGQFVGFDFTVDGTRFTVREGLTTNYGLRKTASWYGTGNQYIQGYANAQVRVTGLIPGSHAFKLQWMRASSPGVVVNITADDVVVFSAQEVLH